MLGQGRRAGRWGFDLATRAGSRRMEMDGHERLGQRRSPGGKGREADFPTQAQVAAWARGRERRAAGRRVRWSARMGRGSWAECAGARARGQAVGRACAGWAEMVK